MMSCKKVSELMSTSLDRTLSFSERLGMVAHSLICKGCTHYKQHLLFIRAASHHIGRQWDENNDDTHLSPDAVLRIKDHINKIINK